MEKAVVTLEKGVIECFLIPLQHASFVLLKAKKGYVMCEYLNMEVADKMDDIAGKITSVKTIDDAFHSNIVQVSYKAKEIGLYPRMSVLEFLNKIC